MELEFIMVGEFHPIKQLQESLKRKFGDNYLFLHKTYILKKEETKMTLCFGCHTMEAADRKKVKSIMRKYGKIKPKDLTIKTRQ